MLKIFGNKKKRSLGAFNYNRWTGHPMYLKRDYDDLYKGFARSVYHANKEKNEFDSRDFLEFFYSWWMDRAFTNIKKH
ncbi:putative rI lysis inhibition regulator, membrane protein [Ochrobactrum phage vB_OspM_OC]|nr:putative rI lysis inhibition regulator, membrane protein [Ochrobactrum phage vB_OspM_OC]